MGADMRVWAAGSLMGLIVAVGSLTVAGAQQAATEGTGAKGPGIVGIEQGDLPTAMQGAIQALHDRQTSLEAALRELEERINVLAEASDATADLIARGNDPLVSLEIEQLWTVIGSLERENALLREELDTLGTSAGN